MKFDTKTGAVASVEQNGDFKYDEGPRNASAERAQLDMVADRLTLLTSIGSVIIWAIGGRQVLEGHMLLGVLTAFTAYMWQFYQPITFGKNTIVPRVSASLKLGDGNVPLYDQVPLGGFLNLSGLSRGALFGQNSALAQLVC